MRRTIKKQESKSANASFRSASLFQIAVAQISPVVGDFAGNRVLIRQAYERACKSGARVLVTPELSVCGYPPHDLVGREDWVSACGEAVNDLCVLTEGQTCALVVGSVDRNPASTGRAVQNVAWVLEGGKVVFRQAKTLLPTYDIFDEARYFEPASDIGVWTCEGQRIVFAICEDLWSRDIALGRKIYPADPIERYPDLKPTVLISLSASPYEWGKRERRESVHSEVARQVGAPLIYVNQFGANDEILFDGGSFALQANGELAGRLAVFSESFGMITVDEGRLDWIEPIESAREDSPPVEIEVLLRGLTLGIRDYFIRTGFKKAVLGLSGGIDSAVVAVLAVRALGRENVLGIAMPSQYSSSHSLEDAETLATRLGIRLEVKPIKFSFASMSRELADRRGTLAPIALENLQSRLRGLTLMTLANHDEALVLTTGNKSEIAMGYCTLYGDMVGALAPIGDLFKTRVYQLARYLNAQSGTGPELEPIPARTLTKAPSAELRPGQTDQDSLPPYDLLDSILQAYLEENASVLDLEKRFSGSHGLPRGGVRELVRRVEVQEFKRRQAAPVLKVSQKAFGLGRRMPIAKAIP